MRILNNRVRSRTESKVMELQGDCRQGRSCIDQVFTIRKLSEQVLEKNAATICSLVYSARMLGVHVHMECTHFTS